MSMKDSCPSTLHKDNNKLMNSMVIIPDKISIVLVLKEFTHANGASFNNLDRFLKIGMRTYTRFLNVECVSDFFVIVPRTEFDRIKKRLYTEYPDWPWRIIVEDVIVAKTVPDGWAKQQTAKLAVSSLIKTSHYLIIDDDTYLTRPIGSTADLFDSRGRALMNTAQIDYPFFYLWSAQVIDIDFDLVQNAPCHMGITPEIFVTDIVKELVALLESRYGSHLKWQEYLAAHKFTEYCMYWSFLIKKGAGVREQYYACDGDCEMQQLYGQDTVSSSQDMKLQIKLSFTKNDNFLFSFVQSSLPYIVEDVEEEIMKYL